jgi:glycosyltransferase involved in cell wall biosynthesis
MSQNVLFVGRGTSGVCWYRCALPAMHLGADWVGITDEPDGSMRLRTGATSRPFSEEALGSYDVVVLQQVRGVAWASRIRALRDAGVTVLYEIDDDLHALRKKDDHDFAETFDRGFLRDMEIAMRATDGVITSTPYLARRLRRFHGRLWVCENGIDLSRYALSPTPHAGVVVGWAGGTGHLRAMTPWLRQLDTIMYERPDVRFVSVGQPFANLLQEHHGAERCLSVPFHSLETYPAAMTTFDLALAPADGTNFYKAKSDLRWLEASALGIPLIADPVVYPHIEDGVTGLHAATPAQAGAAMRRLIDDAALRARIGEQARAHVTEHRAMAVAARQWRAVLEQATARPGAVAVG